MNDLEGILVVALEQAVAAPYASCKLADAGARVIKIERPEGDFARKYDRLVMGESSYFVWLNRGKESICLDLKNPSDVELVRGITAKADVFIQNLAPGAAERLGLGADTLTAAYPSLIYCTISGYGEQGPLRNQKAYDMLVQGESGLISVNGTDSDIARVGISICDISAGMTAFAAILQALLARAQSGNGRVIEVSLFHAISDWMNVPYLQTRYGNKPPPRVGVRHPTISPYGAFNCADGRQVLLSIQNEREWSNLCCAVLNDTQLTADPRFDSNVNRVANNAVLEEIINQRFAALSREAAIALLTESGIACGRLSDMDDLLHHPQLKLQTVTAAMGDIEVLAPGATVKGQDIMVKAVPTTGEHTDAIRKEFAL